MASLFFLNPSLQQVLIENEPIVAAAEDLSFGNNGLVAFGVDHLDDGEELKFGNLFVTSGEGLRTFIVSDTGKAKYYVFTPTQVAFLEGIMKNYNNSKDLKLVFVDNTFKVFKTTVVDSTEAAEAPEAAEASKGHKSKAPVKHKFKAPEGTQFVASVKDLENWSAQLKKAGNKTYGVKEGTKGFKVDPVSESGSKEMHKIENAGVTEEMTKTKMLQLGFKTYQGAGSKPGQLQIV